MIDRVLTSDQLPLPRPGWVGPLVGFDLVRLARQRRSFLLRFAYAGFLLAITCVYFYRISASAEVSVARAGAMAQLAEGFVAQFFIWQSVALFLFVPAYLGGSVTEEREKGTLDLLFTTHLTNWEFVAGKLLSRLMHLFGMLLVGVPVLALAQLFGGVNPSLLIGNTLAAVGGLWSFGAFSLMRSAQSRSVTQGVMRSFGGLLGFQLAAIFVTIICSCGLLTPVAAISSPLAFTILVSRLGASETILAGGIMFFLCHLIAGLYFVRKTLRFLRRWQFPKERMAVLVFRPLDRHADQIPSAPAANPSRPSAAPASNESNRNKRAIDQIVYLTEPEPGEILESDRSRPHSVEERFFYPRPPIGDSPLLWKELHTGRRFSSLTIMATFVDILLLIFGCIVACATAMTFLIFLTDSSRFAQDLHGLRHLLAFLFFCMVTILVLAAAMRAAGCLAVERSQHTWDGLLALPCPRAHLFLAKAVGSVFIHKRWLIFLGVLFGLLFLTGGVHPASALLLMWVLSLQLAALVAFSLWLSGLVMQRFVAQIVIAGLFFFLALSYLGLREAQAYAFPPGPLDPYLELAGTLHPISALGAVYFSWGAWDASLPSALYVGLVQGALAALLALLFFWLALRPYLPASRRDKPTTVPTISAG